MFKLIIEIDNFSEKVLSDEIKLITDKKVKLNQLSKNYFSIEVDDKKKLQNVFSDIYYYSRLINKIYFELNQDDLEKINKSNSENFKIISIEINKKNYNILDLTNFDLSDKEYMLNKINEEKMETKIPSSLVNYCLYLLEVDNEENLSIIDPIANLGEVIIESSLFHPRQPLNVQKRYNLPFCNFFNLRLNIPKKKNNDNKYTAIVTKNKDFKLLRENISYSSSKIKMSKFELDWLDVKFQEAQFDYVITSLCHLKTEDFNKIINELLYMSEFIYEEEICIISHKKIDKKIIKKNNLNLEVLKEIKYKNDTYFIHILS